MFSSEAVSNRTWRRKNACTVCSKNMFDFVLCTSRVTHSKYCCNVMFGSVYLDVSVNIVFLFVAGSSLSFAVSHDQEDFSKVACMSMERKYSVHTKESSALPSPTSSSSECCPYSTK